MARTTTNYGWNISEGSDLVNPLTDIFPNFESLDTDLKEVSDASIGEATELKTGTVHALTRTDADKDVFKFTATSNFTAGETFTVDSEQVSALTTSGEQLTTGCYIIGSEVLVAKKGTLLTFYISNVITDASTLEGHSASYFASASDLNNTNADVLTLSNKVGSAILTTEAHDCSGAINELNRNLSVRYNSQTDRLEVLLNGTWVPTLKVWAQQVNIWKNGVFGVEVDNGVYASINGYTPNAFAISGSNLVSQIPSAQNACSSLVVKEEIDYSAYSTVTIVTSTHGTLTIDVSQYSGTGYLGIAFQRNNSGYTNFMACIASDKTNFSSNAIPGLSTSTPLSSSIGSATITEITME